MSYQLLVNDGKTLIQVEMEEWHNIYGAEDSLIERLRQEWKWKPGTRVWAWGVVSSPDEDDKPYKRAGKFNVFEFMVKGKTCKLVSHE